MDLKEAVATFSAAIPAFGAAVPTIGAVIIVWLTFRANTILKRTEAVLKVKQDCYTEFITNISTFSIDLLNSGLTTEERSAIIRGKYAVLHAKYTAWLIELHAQ